MPFGLLPRVLFLLEAGLFATSHGGPIALGACECGRGEFVWWRKGEPRSRGPHCPIIIHTMLNYVQMLPYRRAIDGRTAEDKDT